MDPGDVERIATRRLLEFAALTRAHGSEFWVLVPPRPEDRGEADAVIRAGRAAGVHVIATTERSRFAADSFSDGIHLKPGAAQLFTREIAERMRVLLTADSPRSPGRRSARCRWP